MNTFGYKQNIKKNNSSLFAEDIIKQIRTLEVSKNETLTEIVSKAGLKKVLLVQSSSNFRMKSFSNLILESFAQMISPLETIRIIGNSITSETILNQIKERLRNQGLFTKAKIVIFQNFDEIKTKYQTELAQEILSCTETFVILPINDEIPKSLDVLKNISIFASLSPLSGPKLEKWIDNECIKLGTKGCDSAALNILTKNFGTDDIDKIAKLIEKASLLTASNEKISEKEINQLIRSTIEKDMMEIFNSVAKKDSLGLSISLNSVIKSGSHPLQIFTFINKAIKTLIANKDSSGGAENSKDLHNPWFLKKLSPSQFSESRLNKSLPILAKLEFELKNNSLSETVVLNQLLGQI
jgi:DNA polymerase III delta subunit